MKPLVLAAGMLLAAVCVAGASSAHAADIYGSDPAYRDGSPYDDPRYGQIYGPPTAPRGPAYGAPPYAPPPYAYKDPPETYPEAPRRYTYAEPRYPGEPSPYTRSHCVPREVIRRELVRRGWHDFQDLELRPRVAVLQARQRSGAVYRIVVDRCTGEVVRARMIEPPYRPRDYGQRYYPRAY
ncbi:MAG: hypothetical protein KDJ41_16625 [Hyphomicrobiaceae bacterium]|nr:hypothetical protein [Hyphomicrobiaceae bacterium]